MSSTLDKYNAKMIQYIPKQGKVAELLQLAEDKSGVQKVYLVYGLLSFTAFWLMFGYGAQLVCNTLGFVFPAYCSIKALESPSKEDDQKWLTYWVVFALFSVLEFFSDTLVSWVPFYWLSKCVFMIWCMAPIANNGSAVIYNKVVLPLFMRHQPKIDGIINKAKDKGTEFLSKGLEKAKDVAAEHQLNKND